MRTRTPFLLALLILAALANICHAIAVASAVTPKDMLVGEYGRYVVTVKGSSVKTLKLTLPQVDGLIILDNASVSSNVSVVNGSYDSSVQYSYPVRATREGRFTIPEIEATIDGEKVSIPAAALNATKDGSISNDAMIVEIAAPERMYAGQSARAELRILVRSDLNLASPINPVFKGTENLLAQSLDNRLAKQGKAMRGSTSYMEIMVPFVISATKQGQERMEFHCDSNVRQPRRQSGVIGGRADPLEEMMRNMRSLDLDDISAPLRAVSANAGRDIEVLPLPRPAPEGFEGLIGNFSISRKLGSDKGRVGEPVELILKVEGEGALRQILAPKFEGDDNWRVYPPSEEASQDDELGLKGSKTFKYLITPLRPGKLKLPPMRIAHFDPGAGRYVEQLLAGESVDVASVPGALPPPPRRVETGKAQASPRAADGLHGIVLLYEAPPYGALLPPQRDALFMLAQLLPAALLAVSIALPLRRRMNERDPYGRVRKTRTKVATAALAKARRAAQGGHMEQFFTNARICLKNTYAAAEPERQPETVSAADLVRKLGTDDALLRRDLNLLFNGMDALRYGAIGSSPDALYATLASIHDRLIAR